MIEFRHVGYNVKSLAKSLHFWCDTLGGEIDKLYSEPRGLYIDTLTGLDGVVQHWAKVWVGDCLLELVQWVEPGIRRGKSKYNVRGINHICLTVDDAFYYYDKLSDAGYDCQQVQDDPPGNVMNFVCRGPDNEIVEFVEVLT